jgi:DNA polymerase elongation subunit (family B)
MEKEGFLLDIDYITEKDEEGHDRPVIRLWCKSKDGSDLIVLDKNFEPYFYAFPYGYEYDVGAIKELIEELCIDREGEEIRVKRVESCQKKLLGVERTVLKIFAAHPRHVPVLREEVKRVGLTVLEADILFAIRYLIDNQLRPFDGVKVEGEEIELGSAYTTGKKAIAASKVSYKKMTELPRLKILAFDCEMASSYGMPSPRRDPIIIIAVAYQHQDNEAKTRLFVLDDEAYKEGDDETVIRNFLTFIGEQFQPDIIVGYNSDGFDWQYIKERAKLQEIRLGVGADGSTVQYEKGGILPGVNIAGRLNVDLFKLAKRDLDSVKVKRLENVAEFLGVMNKNDRVNLSPREITECWLNASPSARERLYEYAKADAVSTLGIATKVLPLQIELSKMVGYPLDELAKMGRGRQVEAFLTAEAFKRGELVPPKRGAEKTYEGGFVLPPERGLHEDVIALDFSSMYPTIMISFNISPDTFVESQHQKKEACGKPLQGFRGGGVEPHMGQSPTDEVYTAPEVGHAFRKEPDGFFKSIMSDLIARRKGIKNEMKRYDKTSDEYRLLDIQQQSIKILTNCFSGDTLVLTIDGVKNIKDIKIGDILYTLNPGTFEIELAPVIETQVFFCDYINSITGRGLNFLVTDEHRFLQSSHPPSVSYKFKTVSELKHQKRVYLPPHNPWKGSIKEYFSLWDYVDDTEDVIFKPNIKACHDPGITKNPIFRRYAKRYYKVKKNFIKNPDEFESEFNGQIYLKSYRQSHLIPWRFPIKDFLSLCGWYISEGHLSHIARRRYGGKLRGESYEIVITQKTHKEEVEDILRKLELRYSNYVTNSGVGVFKISNKYLYKTLRNLFGEGAQHKRIAPQLFSYDHEILKSLYSALMSGNGDKDQRRYSTLSKQLAEDIFRLIILLGYKGRIVYDRDGLWRVWIYNRKRTSFRGDQIKQIEWNDLVYCVTVNKNHIILAGRDGWFEWAGQSFYGYTGWSAAKFYKRECAEATTAWGRYFIKQAISMVEEVGFQVIYSDTDSIFAKLTETESGITDRREETLKKAKEISERISKELPLELEIQDFFKAIFFTGKKKRYAALTDKGEIVVRGLEVRRGDWCEVAKEVQTEVIRLILVEKDPKRAMEYVKRIIQDLKEGKIPLDKLIIHKTITRKISGYETKQAHVIAAERALASPSHIAYEIGSKIPYVVIKGPGKTSDRAFPVDIIESSEGNEIYADRGKYLVDVEYYTQHQVIPVAHRVLQLFGYELASFEEEEGGQKTLVHWL